MRVITLLSFRGGVGRTTMAVNLGRAMSDLALSPIRLVDLDPNRALRGASGLEHPWYISGPPCWGTGRGIAVHTLEGVDMSGSPLRGARRAFLDVASGHHITIVDCPPGLSSWTRIALSQTDISVLLVDPDRDLTGQVKPLEKYLARMSNPPLIRVIGVRKGSLCESACEVSTAGDYTWSRRMYPMMIPESRDLPSSFRAGVSILDYAPGSTAANHSTCLALLLEREVRKAKVERFLQTMQPP